MQIPVNKDLEDYKDDFFKGLTLRQTVMSALTLAAGVGSFVLFHMVLGLPQTIALYLVFPAALPFAAAGFIKIDGRSPFEYLKKRHEAVSHPHYDYIPIAFSLMEHTGEDEEKENKEETAVITSEHSGL